MTAVQKNPIEGAASASFDRRTMIKAAAWAAPVVAVAVAAPMAAASLTVNPSGTVSFAYDVGAGTVTASNINFAITTTGTPGASPIETGPLSARIRFRNASYTSPLAINDSLGNGWVVSNRTTGATYDEITATYAPGITTNTAGTFAAPTISAPIVLTGTPGTVPPAESIRIVTVWTNHPTWGQTTFWPNED